MEQVIEMDENVNDNIHDQACGCMSDDCECETLDEAQGSYDPDDDDEFTVEDVAYDAHNKVDALVQLLVRKGILTEDEVDAEVDRLIEDLEDDDD